MELIKAYNRQAHARITVISAVGGTLEYNHRTTDMNLFATAGGLVLEINSFTHETDEEPHIHEMIIHPIQIYVRAVEEAPAAEEPSDIPAE